MCTWTGNRLDFAAHKASCPFIQLQPVLLKLLLADQQQEMKVNSLQKELNTLQSENATLKSTEDYLTKNLTFFMENTKWELHEQLDEKDFSLLQEPNSFVRRGMLLEGVKRNGGFSEKSCKKANFYGLWLFIENFSGAKLNNANFCKTQLGICNFSGADVSGADFSDACLASADFTNANMDVVKLNNKTDFSYAKIPKKYQDMIVAASCITKDVCWLEEAEPKK